MFPARCIKSSRPLRSAPIMLQTKPLSLVRPLLLVLLLAFSSVSFSEDRILPEANYTGTLITSNPNTIREGSLVLTPYVIYLHANDRYDPHGRREKLPHSYSQWQTLLPIAYGITPRLTGKLTLGGNRTSEKGDHTRGLQATDVALRLQYQLLAPNRDGSRPSVSVFISQNLLTGSYDSLRDHPLDGMGSGAKRTNLSLLSQKVFWLANGRPLRLRGQLSWSPKPPSIRLQDVSVYSTPHGFRGIYYPGSQLNLSIGSEYSMDAHWVPAIDIVASRQGRASLSGTIQQEDGSLSPMQRTDNYSAIYSIVPAIEYNFNGQYGLIAGVQFSLGGHNTRAPITPRIAFNAVF
ncbi:hypothetical protein [Dyella acidiphila]|uniref:Transporter n=1 Tax=Dyella acidiphila TaxID=2775866 RepID=A0ABR9G5M7_9GAMM|nr:hypothetical protein [Dyella acidiphila]MBE1159312.1 hypothetical protein [Dyella acidiphila]